MMATKMGQVIRCECQKTNSTSAGRGEQAMLEVHASTLFKTSEQKQQDQSTRRWRGEGSFLSLLSIPLFTFQSFLRPCHRCVVV